MSYRLLFIGLALIFLLGSASASYFGFYYGNGTVPETYQTNQIYAGAYYQPSNQYAGWTYYSYYPSSGYPTLGGGRFYPAGYYNGGYQIVAQPANYYYPYAGGYFGNYLSYKCLTTYC